MFDLKGYETSLLEGAWITLEVALSGGLLLQGIDDALRDLAGLSGSYRPVDLGGAQRASDRLVHGPGSGGRQSKCIGKQNRRWGSTSTRAAGGWGLCTTSLWCSAASPVAGYFVHPLWLPRAAPW